jgi:hypothetical protein
MDIIPRVKGYTAGRSLFLRHTRAITYTGITISKAIRTLLLPDKFIILVPATLRMGKRSGKSNNGTDILLKSIDIGVLLTPVLISLLFRQ